MENLAVTILSGVVVAFASAWITVRLSFRQFRSERWWERKVEAYDRIISALHDSTTYAEAKFSAHCEERELKNSELAKKSRDAHLEIQRAADMGAYLLSKEARERLVRYRNACKQEWDDSNFFGYLECEAAASSSCLSDMIEIAKRDLGTR